MSSRANSSTNLEALLRNACRRAMGLGLSFTNQIRAYRSIIALAREVRLRLGGALFDSGSDTLSSLLAAVCEHASDLSLDPELPFPDAILVERLVVQLSRAARRAAVREPIERKFLAQHPMHREDAAKRTISKQIPMHPEESPEPEVAQPTDIAIAAQDPLQREHAAERTISEHIPKDREEPPQPEATDPVAKAFSPKHPIQREDAADDDRLSAWRRDHKTDRDQRAHEKLRTVVEERVYTKIKAINQRDHEEQAAAERVAAA